MLKNDTLKNGTSRIGLYGSAPPGDIVITMNDYYFQCSLKIARVEIPKRYPIKSPINNSAVIIIFSAL